VPPARSYSRRVKLYALALCLVACSKDPSANPPPAPKATATKPAPPPALRPAPKGTWSKISSNLHIEDKDLKRPAEIGISLVGGSLSITPMRVPIGSVIEVAGTRGEIKKEHGSQFDVPMEGPIGDAPWAKLKPTGKYGLAEKHDWNVPIVVTLPGREPLRMQLPPMKATVGLEKLFVEMATSSRTWPEEANGPVPVAAAWTVNGFEAIGTAEKTRDVRMVAIGKQIDNARTKRCTGYAGAKDFTATSFDLELSIVDRVTKQPLATKTFTGQPSCPQTVVTGPGTPPAAHTGPSHKTMIGWVSSQLPALAKKL
jgi:hypothetical protein